MRSAEDRANSKQAKAFGFLGAAGSMIRFGKERQRRWAVCFALRCSAPLNPQSGLQVPLLHNHETICSFHPVGRSFPSEVMAFTASFPLTEEMWENEWYRMDGFDSKQGRKCERKERKCERKVSFISTASGLAESASSISSLLSSSLMGLPR